MSQLPEAAPKTAGEAFAHINAVVSPTVDDLKIMVFLEASGLDSYYNLAKSAPNDEMRKLLQANGREEMAHAHRVSQVIKLISGEDFAPPAAAENPFVSGSSRPLSRGLLETIVAAETGGCSLYETWAAHIGHDEAASLLRQNGKEETRHGERAAAAIALLES